jgi:hypothetical protein
LFESFQAPDLAARLRVATVVPLAAFLGSEAYFSFASFLRTVPPWMFWIIVLLTFAGAAFGAVFTTGEVARRRAELGGRAISWLVAAGMATLVCTWRFLGLALPWL